jgi:hypothetical protein
MDRATWRILRQGGSVVLRTSHHIQKPPENGFAHRHGHRRAAGLHWHATGKARGGLERHRTDGFLIEVTVDFENEVGRPVPLHDHGGIDRRQV